MRKEKEENIIPNEQQTKYKKKIQGSNSNYYIKTKKTLQEKFGRIKYALCDEYSMIGKAMLAAFHRSLTIANSCHSANNISEEQINTSIPFGGVNVIYFGDILQYKPIKDQPLFTQVFKTAQDTGTKTVDSKELYFNDNNTRDTVTLHKNANEHLNSNHLEYAIGRSLWLQTKYAVLLQQQIRTIDTKYRHLLNRLRKSECTKQDHELLLTRVVGSKNCNVKSLDDPLWRDATILVFSNEVRQEINNHTAISRSAENETLLYVCVAKDIVSIGNNILPNSCKNILKNILKLTDDKTADLPGLLPLIPGMPVLLTDNICNQLGLTNGTNGIFQKLIYESDDNPSENEDLIFPIDSTQFIRKPITALVEIPTFDINGSFEGLPKKIVPIPLIEGTFKVSTKKVLNSSLKIFFKKPQQFSVKSTQFPIVPSYSMTTYKAQGQTLPKVVVDLVLPPFATKEIATVYVPLSRVQSLDNILILRHFPFESINIPATLSQRLELEKIYSMHLHTQTLFNDSK